MRPRGGCVFLAGLTVIGDLITLINYFLGGEITTRFILKVLVVLLVGGGVFMHFLADIWGYWVQYPSRAMMVGVGVGILILASIGAGFFIMGSPGQVRLYRFDDQKVNDLNNIQYQVVTYWQQKEKLPVELADLHDPLNGSIVPLDPQSGESYTYQATGQYSFKLCATFNAETQVTSPTLPRAVSAPVMEKGVGLEQATWQHGVGEVCFDRTIDPERYPPYPKQKVL